LGLLGDKVNALRVPFIGKGAIEADHEKHGGFWDRVTRLVMRYPVIALVASTALPSGLPLPSIDIKTGSAGVSTLPDGLRSKEGFQILQSEFSYGLVTPAEIAIQGDVNSPAVQGALDRLDGILADHPGFSPGTFTANATGDVALYSVPVNGDPTA